MPDEDPELVASLELPGQDLVANRPHGPHHREQDVLPLEEAGGPIS
jgi:hypothetical protein